MEFADYVALAARILEGTGVLVILLGAPVALLAVLFRRKREDAGAYKRYRQYLGRAILLGLELLVAADIIRTVSEDPTLSGVAVLAAIVLIRTFLSFTLELEIEGRWPWQRPPDSPA